MRNASPPVDYDLIDPGDDWGRDGLNLKLLIICGFVAIIALGAVGSVIWAVFTLIRLALGAP